MFSRSNDKGFTDSRPARWRAHFLITVAMLLLSAAHLGAQTDFLTYTGVWTTLPISGLGTPVDVVGDTSGNLYITDSSQTSVVTYTSGGVQGTIGTNLSSPQGIAIDGSGNLYVASFGNNQVYKITPTGTQTAIGSGWSGPSGVAVDIVGDVYVVDSSGLSEVTAGGTQSSVVSESNLQGLAIDVSGNIFFASTAIDAIYKIFAGTTTPNVFSSAASVQNLYADAQGNVYFADTNAGVQRVDDGASDITTFGNASVGYGVWGDTHQNLYIADQSGSIQKLALGPVNFGSVNYCPTGATTTPCSVPQTLNFAYDSLVYGSQTMSSLTQGAANLDYTITADTCTGDVSEGSACSITVAFTPQGAGLRSGAALAIGNSTYNDGARRPVGPKPRSHSPVRPRDEVPGTRLSQVSLYGVGLAPVGVFNTGIISTSAFAPVSVDNNLASVVGTANGDVYVGDFNNCVVQKFSAGTTTVVAGDYSCSASSGDDSAATSANVPNPVALAVNGAGDLFIAEYYGSVVRKVDSQTGVIYTVAGNGSDGYSGDGGSATAAELQTPTALTVDSDGNLFIADFQASVVRRVDAVTGIITTIAGNGADGYSGDNGPATSAAIGGPNGLALDSANNLFIADYTNNVVRKVSGGTITTIAGTGTAGYSGDGGMATSAEISSPTGLAVDPAGDVYIADVGNDVIRKVEVSSSSITTVAGNGNLEYSGDGGSAVTASLAYPNGVFVMPNGVIYIPDTGNGVLRQVTGQTGIAAFGNVTVSASSAAQDTVFSNIGTTSLTLSSLTKPTGFNLGGADTTCTSTTSLTVGTSCVLGIQFAPVAQGLASGNVSVVDNLGNVPASAELLAVTGTGTPPPTQLAFSGPISGITAGGNLGTVTVDVEGANASIIGVSRLITLTLTGPGGYSQSVNVTASIGVATFDLSEYTLATAGTYTLTASSANLTSAQTTVVVAAGAGNPATTPAKLAMGTVPTTVVVDTGLGVVPVDVENSVQALLPTATNVVTLTITGPGGYSHSVTVTATGGVATFDFRRLELTTIGVYTLTATSPGLTPAQATVTVTAAAANPATTPAKLAMGTVPATLVAGASLGVIAVDVENIENALLPLATNLVTLTITGPDEFVHSVVVTATAGVANFNLSGLPLDGGVYTLTATSEGLTQAVSTVTVTAASPAAMQLSIAAASIPATLASGGHLGVIPVSLVDSSGTLVTSANNNVTLAITGPGGYSYAVTVAAVNGVASFNWSAVALTAPGAYTLTATSGSLTAAVARVIVTVDFTIAAISSAAGPIVPGAVADFNFTLAPASGIFNTPITLTASGLPAGATYSFSPGTVTPGSSPVSTQLTIQTSAHGTAALPGSEALPWGGAVFSFLLLPFIAGLRVFRRALLPALVLGLMGLSALSGCGAGGLFGQPQQSYPITITGTSGSVSHSATVTLTVQ